MTDNESSSSSPADGTEVDRVLAEMRQLMKRMSAITSQLESGSGFRATRKPGGLGAQVRSGPYGSRQPHFVSGSGSAVGGSSPCFRGNGLRTSFHRLDVDPGDCALVRIEWRRDDGITVTSVGHLVHEELRMVILVTDWDERKVFHGLNIHGSQIVSKEVIRD